MDIKTAKRVRCIILKDNGIWVIKRERIENGEKRLYYVFPGGGIEKGETPVEAAKREALEELGAKIKIIKKIYEYEYNKQVNICFLCKHIGGIMGTGKGPEFNDEAYKNRGDYTITFLPISEASKVNLVPNEIRDKVINNFNNLKREII